MSDKVDFDDYTSNYNTLLREQTGFFSPNEAYFAQYKVDIVRSKITTPVHKVLEFGCGIGRNIPFLQRAFPQATIKGFDISEASLEIARQENPGIEFHADTSTLQDAYDLIFVAGVFHHVAINGRAEIADTLHSLLRAGGDLVVFEHNPFNPVTRHIVSNCPYDADAVLLRPAELRRILADAALTVSESGYCLFVPPRLSLLAPLENWFSWLPLGGQYWVHARKPR